MKRSMGAFVRLSPRAHWLASCLAIGLASSQPACEAPSSTEVEQPADEPTWRADLASDDPSIRQRAMPAIVADPSREGELALQRSAVLDDSSEVRQQAAIALGRMGGADAPAFLRQLSRTEQDPNVFLAAQAGLKLMYDSGQLPRRSHLSVDYPARFAAGAAMELRARIGSEATARKARLTLHLPDGFRMAEAQRAEWKGSLEANRDRDVTFAVIAPATPVRGAARLTLSVAYDRGDGEQSKSQRLVALDPGGGHFEELPVHVTEVEVEVEGGGQ